MLEYGHVNRDELSVFCQLMVTFLIVMVLNVKDKVLSGLRGVDLTCVKRDRVLFDSLQVNISPGELVYLRGPNGAGKTSLLRILTGLSIPDAGYVEYNGVNIQRDSSLFHSSLIYIGHKTGLNGAFTAVENLVYWCHQHNVTFTRATTIEVLDSLGLVGLEDVPVRFLSAGQQRRVALARLWLKKAALWVLDEPFTALDVAGVAMLEQMFNTQVNRGGSVVTTSHQALSENAGAFRHIDLEYMI